MFISNRDGYERVWKQMVDARILELSAEGKSTSEIAGELLGVSADAALSFYPDVMRVVSGVVHLSLRG